MEGNRYTAAGDANLLRANRRASKDTGSSGILSKRAVIQPSAFPHAVPGETDPPPCALGAELADGSARRLDPRLVPCARAGGAIFAGFLCLDADAGQQAAGIEINANHLRAVTEGVVTGTARPISLGRRSQVWEVRIVDGNDKLVCVSRCTMAVIEVS